MRYESNQSINQYIDKGRPLDNIKVGYSKPYLSFFSFPNGKLARFSDYRQLVLSLEMAYLTGPDRLDSLDSLPYARLYRVRTVTKKVLLASIDFT